MTLATLEITIDGTIKPDGSIELNHPSNLPPGPVKITLRRIPIRLSTEEIRLPDGPWSDENIPTPFDLTRLGESRPVRTRAGTRRLPDFVIGEKSFEE